MDKQKKNKVNKKDPSRFRQASRSTSREIDYREEMELYIKNGVGTYNEKLENFPKYVSRQTTARYLALYEIFKLIENVQGDIIEGGVNWGGGLMWFSQLSTVMEPINFQRRIIGFDTFEGYSSKQCTPNDKLSVAWQEQSYSTGKNYKNFLSSKVE